MPKKLERALKAAAKRHGYRPGTERYNRYVYGTMKKVEKKDGEKT